MGGGQHFQSLPKSLPSHFHGRNEAWGQIPPPDWRAREVTKQLGSDGLGVWEVPGSDKPDLCLVYFYLFFYRDRRWRAAVNAVARGRRASALARRSARSEHMGTSTEVVSKIESPGFCASLP